MPTFVAGNPAPAADLNTMVAQILANQGYNFAGNGELGALNVTSGTTDIALDTLLQYTSVSVSAGATLSTSATTGFGVFMKVQGNFTNAGTVDFSGKLAQAAGINVFIRGQSVAQTEVKALPLINL